MRPGGREQADSRPLPTEPHMSKYFFDVYDGAKIVIDDTGIACKSLLDVGDQAVTVLPDIAREELPDGPNRVFRVKVRHEEGHFVFRASLALASAWLVDHPDGSVPPGEKRAVAALRRTREQLRTIRRELAEDGFSEQMQEIDSLVGVAQLEAERLLKREVSKGVSR
ncbi:hypothetical protein BPNPMPFG_002433 [Mesorhizobium sp. AR07]|uniref:DUF6894 family protein n=1 Tax=Mesorhizobium sp. AR07 TaxID=2865838 RepID=UPI00215ED11E|nr:hypothetical protein [Mesorhizobium sp. AR07]UVK46728.1 hypothetical protein BPNPMPFG_002433 [Mesorhizobium sp. AR07]